MTLSQKRMICINIFCAIITTATVILKIFDVDVLLVLTAIMPLWLGENGIYSYKAKAENVAKIISSNGKVLI
jgi:hypothetical protein